MSEPNDLIIRDTISRMSQ